MHKRPKIHDVHTHGPQGIPCVHNMYDNGARSAFPRFSGIHNVHIPDAQCAPHTCKTCIRATFRPDTPHRAGRQQDSHLFTDIQKRTPLTRNGRLSRAAWRRPFPHHTVGPGGPTYPRKAHPAGSAQADSSFNRFTACPGSRGAPYLRPFSALRAARMRRIDHLGLCAQSCSSPPLLSGPRLFSSPEADPRGHRCWPYLSDTRNQNITATYDTRRRSQVSGHTACNVGLSSPPRSHMRRFSVSMICARRGPKIQHLPTCVDL